MARVAKENWYPGSPGDLRPWAHREAGRRARFEILSPKGGYDDSKEAEEHREKPRDRGRDPGATPGAQGRGSGSCKKAEILEPTVFKEADTLGSTAGTQAEKRHAVLEDAGYEMRQSGRLWFQGSQP